MNKDLFQTPKPLNHKKRKSDAISPFHIPPSPCMKKLGYGTGVNVFLVERYSPSRGCYKSPWAVKKISSKLKNCPEVSKRLKVEAKVLSSLKHPSIIGYRSFMKSTDNTPCLVMESGQKSLGDILEESTGPIAHEKIIKVAKALASALTYLHHSCLLLHGDLKSPNILIKGDFEEIKLCDFGVCLKLDKQLNAVSSEDYVGTECWAAPEVLLGETVSNKTDIFSYGLVIWEMLSLSAPHLDKLDIPEDDDSLTEEEIAKMEELQDIEFQKHLGTRPPIPEKLDESYSKVLELFYCCTEETPSERPSAKDIMEAFFS